MNMIIALLGNAYNESKENSSIANLKELAEIILKVESLLVFKRKNNSRNYIQICSTSKKIENSYNLDVSSLIKTVSSTIPGILEKISVFQEKEKSDCANIELMLKKVEEDFKQETEELCKSMLEDKDFITKLTS